MYKYVIRLCVNKYNKIVTFNYDEEIFIIDIKIVC